MPTTSAAQLVNTPDMIETTERLSRVLKEINLEGNRAQLTDQDSFTVKMVHFPRGRLTCRECCGSAFILMRIQIRIWL
jgi:hypothetical protein